MDDVSVRLREIAEKVSRAVEGADDNEFLAILVNALKEAYQLGRTSVSPTSKVTNN